MSAWKTVKVTEVDPHVIVLTMNRPEHRNAISAEMAEELEACLISMKDKPDLRALILTGEGSTFGAGADLKERAVLTPEQAQGARETVLRCIDMIEALRAPLIAMINGPAIAGSFEIALACDIRLVSDQATFSLPEANKVGAFQGAGGPVRLAKLVGRGRANLVLLTGRRFSAEDAFALGCAEVVVSHERLLEETLSLARLIAANSPEGVAAAKQLILRSNDLDLQAAMKLSRRPARPMDGTAAATEAIRAWSGKMRPDFPAPKDPS